MSYNPNNPNGQATMANSAPVAIASDQTLPLPNGAATSAKQPALGTAGTASSDVITVQGIASMTPITVTASSTTGNIAAASADSGNPVKVGGKYNATPPTYTDGNRGDLQLDSKGSVRVVIAQNGSTNTATFDKDSSDADATSTTQNKLAVKARNTVFNGTSWDRQYGDTNGTYTVPKPVTSGGLTISRTLAAASTNATSIKASAGQIYGWYMYNTSAAAKFVKLYNKATSPTVGTDTPVMTIPLPATSGANVFTELGIAFGTGIAMAITGAVGDSDTTAVSANDVIVNILYK